MAISIVERLTLYADQTGLVASLRAQPLTAAGVATGALITTGFVALGGADYRFAGSVPDDTECVRYELSSDAGVAIAVGDRVVNLQASVSSAAVYAVQGIRTRISDSEDDFITLVKSDDRSVVLLFEDESHNPAMIPSTATAALLDSAGSSVGTATVTTITAAAGYMLLRLQAPSSGNLPTTLRITFTGGSGAAYKHDIPVRSFS
jgi:hypothetical protein